MILIRVLFCFHNRREKTENCLRSLLQQKGRGDFFDFEFSLLDDGSTDQSSEMIHSICPDAQIEHADGSWFWARSMSYLFAKAKKTSQDFVLLINDDVIFAVDAVFNVLQDFETAKKKQMSWKPVIVGKTIDPETQAWTYGGFRYRATWAPLWFYSGDPGSGLTSIHTFNANCVLIPQETALPFDLFSGYRHASADTDLGLQMHRAGIPLFQSSCSVGFCRRNPIQGTWKDVSLSMWKRLKLSQTRKGIPFGDHFRFAWRNGGWLWWWFAIQPYVRIIFPRKKKKFY